MIVVMVVIVIVIVIVTIQFERLRRDQAINIFREKLSRLDVLKIFGELSLADQDVFLIEDPIVIGIMKHLIFFTIFFVNDKTTFSIIKRPRVMIFF